MGTQYFIFIYFVCMDMDSESAFCRKDHFKASCSKLKSSNTDCVSPAVLCYDLYGAKSGFNSSACFPLM